MVVYRKRGSQAGVGAGGRAVGGAVPKARGPRQAFFCYQATPYTFVPEISDYFSLNNVEHLAGIFGTYSQVFLPREILFNTGLTWTNGSTTDTDIVYDWSASYGPKWKDVIAEVRVRQAALPPAMRTKFYCYIPLGQRPGTDYELTETEIAKAIDEGVNPSNLGADGVFFDECGYDFATTRAIQNASIVELRTHKANSTNRGCATMNAWLPGDVMESDVDVTYNPGGVDPEFGGDDQVATAPDCFMAESCPVNTSTATSQFVTNYGIQNGRFTVAGNGVQGLNERLQAIFTGRALRDVQVTTLSFIEQSASNLFLERFAHALTAACGFENIAISRNDSFEDFHPRQITPIPYEFICGDRGFVDLRRTPQTTTNGGGSTFSGYTFDCETGTMAFGVDPTLGLHWVALPDGTFWRPEMGGDHEYGGRHWLRPVDTVITSGADDAENAPDTNEGYPRGIIPASQGGVTLSRGMRVLIASGTNAGIWFVYNVVNWDPGGGAADYAYLRRAGDFYDGMMDLSGAMVTVSQGTYAGAVYRVSTANPMRIGSTSIAFARHDTTYEHVAASAPLLEPLTGSGAVAAKVNLAGNNIDVPHIEMPNAGSPVIQLDVILPDEYVSGSAFRVRIYWTAQAGTAGHVVKYTASARGFVNDDAQDAALGGAVSVEDAYIAADDLHVTDVTVTPTGSVSGGAKVVIQVLRDNAPAGTNLAASALVQDVVTRIQRTLV